MRELKIYSGGTGEQIYHSKRYPDNEIEQQVRDDFRSSVIFRYQPGDRRIAYCFVSIYRNAPEQFHAKFETSDPNEDILRGCYEAVSEAVSDAGWKLGQTERIEHRFFSSIPDPEPFKPEVDSNDLQELVDRGFPLSFVSPKPRSAVGVVRYLLTNFPELEIAVGLDEDRKSSSHDVFVQLDTSASTVGLSDRSEDYLRQLRLHRATKHTKKTLSAIKTKGISDDSLVTYLKQSSIIDSQGVNFADRSRSGLITRYTKITSAISVVLGIGAVLFYFGRNELSPLLFLPLDIVIFNYNTGISLHSGLALGISLLPLLLLLLYFAHQNSFMVRKFYNKRPDGSINAQINDRPKELDRLEADIEAINRLTKSQDAFIDRLRSEVFAGTEISVDKISRVKRRRWIETGTGIVLGTGFGALITGGSYLVKDLLIMLVVENWILVIQVMIHLLIIVSGIVTILGLILTVRRSISRISTRFTIPRKLRNRIKLIGNSKSAPSHTPDAKTNVHETKYKRDFVHKVLNDPHPSKNDITNSIEYTEDLVREGSINNSWKNEIVARLQEKFNTISDSSGNDVDDKSQQHMPISKQVKKSGKMGTTPSGSGLRSSKTTATNKNSNLSVSSASSTQTANHKKRSSKVSFGREVSYPAYHYDSYNSSYNPSVKRSGDKQSDQLEAIWTPSSISLRIEKENPRILGDELIDGTPAPCIKDGLMYAVTKEGDLSCINLSDASVQWSTDLRFATGVSPVITEDYVIVPSHKELILIDRCDGSMHVNRRLNTPPVAVAYHDKTIIVTDREGNIDWYVPEGDKLNHVSHAEQPLPEPAVGKPISVDGNTLLASTDSRGTIAVYDPSSGKRIVTKRLQEQFSDTPAATNDTVLLPTKSGKLYDTQLSEFYAKNASNRAEAIDGTVKKFSGPLLSPVVTERKVIAVDVDGNLASFGHTMSQNWRLKIRGKVSAPPVAGGSVLYLPSEDKRLLAIDIKRGEKISNVMLEDYVNSSAVVVNGGVFLATTEGKLYAFNSL